MSGLLVNEITWSCSEITSTAARFDLNNDYLANALFSLLTLNHCEKTTTYMETLVQLYQSRRSAKVARYIGKLYFRQGNYSKAREYFNDALELSKDSILKAKVYYYLSQIELNKGNKQGAYTYAKKSAKEPSVSQLAYLLIGDLFLFQL